MTDTALSEASTKTLPDSAGVNETSFFVVERPRRIIYLIPDNVLRGKLTAVMQRNRFDPIEVAYPEDILRLTGTLRPEAVVVEVTDQKEQMELIRQLKSDHATRSIPILLISDHGDEESQIHHLEQGADDTILRSVSPRVFAARLRAIIRSRQDMSEYNEQLLVFENLMIYPRKHLVFVNGKAIKLTVTEFRILLVLVSRPGWVFSREEIVAAIRPGASCSGSRSVDVSIVRLRSRLQPYGSYIETVRQIGYRFRDASNISRKPEK